jgi:hypothetical protein
MLILLQMIGHSFDITQSACQFGVFSPDRKACGFYRCVFTR